MKEIDALYLPRELSTTISKTIILIKKDLGECITRKNVKTVLLRKNANDLIVELYQSLETTLKKNMRIKMYSKDGEEE
jgi:hypothetical protein